MSGVDLTQPEADALLALQRHQADEQQGFHTLVASVRLPPEKALPMSRNVTRATDHETVSLCCSGNAAPRRLHAFRLSCGTRPPLPSAEVPLATIAGSQVDSFILDDFTAFVIAVDGKRVVAGRQGWSTALPILPGTRNLTVGFRRGQFTTQADLVLDAVSGGQYQVRFISDVEALVPNTYCDFWIADKTT